MSKHHQNVKYTENKGLEMEHNKTLIATRKMRLISLYIDTETEEMLQILKRKKKQYGSVIIRTAIREYFAKHLNSGLVVPELNKMDEGK